MQLLTTNDEHKIHPLLKGFCEFVSYLNLISVLILNVILLKSGLMRVAG